MKRKYATVVERNPAGTTPSRENLFVLVEEQQQRPPDEVKSSQLNSSIFVKHYIHSSMCLPVKAKWKQW